MTNFDEAIGYYTEHKDYADKQYKACMKDRDLYSSWSKEGVSRRDLLALEACQHLTLSEVYGEFVVLLKKLRDGR